MRNMQLTNARKRLEHVDPLLVDTLLAVGLTLLGWLQLAAFLMFRPGVPERAMHLFREPRTPMWLTFVLIAGAFLPLALRRTIPWLALALSGAFALVYQLMPSPPAFVALGPMIAVYSLASVAKKRNKWLIAVLAAVVILAAAVAAFTSTRWMTEAIGTFALLTTAAFFGDASRNRREYVAEVERRAVEAERTREEEARRRVDEERLRIARDVHDVVAHSLSIVAVQAAAADALVDEQPERAHESLGHIRSTSRQALSELRSMLSVLRTGDSAAPLEPAADLSRLDSLADHVRNAGVAVEIETRGDLHAVPALVSVSAYRIVQEALTNVIRHAHASSACVEVDVSPGSLVLEVTDDGIGSRADDTGVGHGVRDTVCTHRCPSRRGSHEHPRVDSR
jgi:signal transduction histidine kinase